MSIPSAESPWLFMGEQEDPELAVWAGRGLRIYDASATGSASTSSPVAASSSGSSFWVYQGAGKGFARCGCGRCFYGPCGSPLP